MSREHTVETLIAEVKKVMLSFGKIQDLLDCLETEEPNEQPVEKPSKEDQRIVSLTPAQVLTYQALEVLDRPAHLYDISRQVQAQAKAPINSHLVEARLNELVALRLVRYSKVDGQKLGRFTICSTEEIR